MLPLSWPRWAWALLGGAGVLLVVIVLVMPRGGGQDLNNSDFMQALKQGEVSSAIVTFQNGTAAISGQLKNGDPYHTRGLASDPALRLEALQARGVNVQYAPTSRLSGLSLLSGLLTLALIAGLVMVLLRSRQGNSQDTTSQFGKSKAAVISEGQVKLNFTDVAGCDEAKQD
ncbi:ATP-dependent metallopeptidase FtsH/Yme1/Tma family protein, partial [Deinococcus malanensis]|uniref:ATP-dependent metallopeptidase FtsH/Yme1/Tma family protein n=1 Tax=Deinococcus malanensis TaxID=1706855 RepID=UPI001E517993